jgi:SAM-dependent methyltransferase
MPGVCWDFWHRTLDRNPASADTAGMNDELLAAPQAEDPGVARGGFPAELAAEIRRRALDEPGFMHLTQVARRGGRLVRVGLRPVQLKTGACLQAEHVDAGRTTVRNLDAHAATAALDDILAQSGARELHLVTAVGDLHARVTRKGKLLISRSKALEREATEPLPHDRVKQQPLTSFESGALLKAIGIADADGRIKASMRGKYDQVNEFLRVIDVLADGHGGRAWNVVDCGCGRAYLTFAAHAYLTAVHHGTVRVRGVDRNPALVATARQLAADLDVASDVQFVQADLAACQLDIEPDLLLSLHACDTATDEALARGVEWRCRHILCAPCCQHELQQQLAGGGAMRAVLRHGILRERLADLLADTFRAQLLRILGYRVRVTEFVAPDATARNLLLRAEYAVSPGQSEAVAEYLALRDLWQVTPWLETRLREQLARYLT